MEKIVEELLYLKSLLLNAPPSENEAYNAGLYTAIQVLDARIKFLEVYIENLKRITIN